MDNIPILHADKVVGYVIMSDEMQQLFKNSPHVWCIEYGRSGYSMLPQHELVARYTPSTSTDTESSDFDLYATGQIVDSEHVLTNGPTPTLADLLDVPGYNGASIYSLSDSGEHIVLFTWDVGRGVWVQHKTTWYVDLTYFKRTGKYYASGTCTVLNVTSLYDIWSAVRDMQKRGEWSGLTDGNHDFVTLINVPDHPHNHPKLIIPPRNE